MADEIVINMNNEAATLPEVDSSDNGKVLAVVDGEWDKSGEYPQKDGTIANAEQLLSSVYVKDTDPFSRRTAGGSKDIGNRNEMKKAVGVTVAWNQYVHTNMFPSVESEFTNGVKVSAVDITKGIITIIVDTGGATVGRSFHLVGSSTEYTPETRFNNLNASHKYLMIGCPSGGNPDTYYVGISSNAAYSPDTGKGGILANYSSGFNFGIVIRLGCPAGTYTFRPQFIDLTQMFGSTIADYLYSLETANAGAGVAFFKKLFPKDYYAYNAGELLSVNTSGRKTVGFNQLKTAPLYWAAEEARVLNKTTFSKLLAGKEYQFNFDSIGTATTWRLAISAYDLNENVITDTSLFTSDLTLTGTGWIIKTNVISAKSWTFTPAKDMWINIDFWSGDTSSSMSMVNGCLHLTWSGYRNGQYEDYKENSYALDSSLTLRGMLKLDANNKLYADGDIYQSIGGVERKRGRIDLGDCAWNVTSETYPRYYTDDIASLIKHPATINDTVELICAKYDNKTVGETYNGSKGISVNTNGRIYIYDNSYGSKAAFETAMDGVYLEYPLAESTTEEADAYTELQIVDDFGTEEFVDYGESQGTRDVSIPVGHETFYPANLRDKLQRLPNLPDSEGNYIVHYEDRQATFVAYTADGRLDDLEEKIPDPPTTDGTYKLTVSVADGTPTYSWESAT